MGEESGSELVPVSSRGGEESRRTSDGESRSGSSVCPLTIEVTLGEPQGRVCELSFGKKTVPKFGGIEFRLVKN